MSLLKGLGLSALILVAAGLVWLWQSTWLKIDSCLDGGGRWDYEQETCQHAG